MGAFAHAMSATSSRGGGAISTVASVDEMRLNDRSRAVECA